ncbi:AAA family ATPase [Anaerosporomusa subterranea]|uniref:AAA family ATPase n=1 Tax=Anaerosporomusa subterranea TaxID=1794912 RepID=A0A154BSH2_ANASB|nr:nucleoside kinase [Anaerosporomusa subterranea]KYZ76922.1 AAA family ATPase [Anaerosporomusa subterranea]
MEKITILFSNGEQREFDWGVSLHEVAVKMAPLYTSPIVAAEVDFVLRDLTFKLEKDCKVTFLDVSTERGNKVYQRSLAFVMIAAAAELFPGKQVTVEHSLGKGLYCEMHLGRAVTQADIDQLKQKMNEIVAENRPLARRVMPVDQAISLFEAAGEAEKVKLLMQWKQPDVAIHTCGEVADYVHGVMAPNAGCLRLFNLRLYTPGIILCFPEQNNPDKLPEFVSQPKLAKVFLEAERWGEILQCSYVATLNDYITQRKIADIMRVAEALHEKKLAEIADFISIHRKQVRVILIAGPSSSGKTTFAQRLGIQLRVNGIRPVPISLDDYFVDRDHTPKDEYGEFDFESIDAIDIPLFNQQLLQLLDGETVEVPTFNFQLGKREDKGHLVSISKDQPLIIEGIHGLNEHLTKDVPREHKVKVYVSALTQLSIDNHNRIPTTDARLIRRIVRDSQFRGHDALTTLRLWPSVRRGEERNIFPFQEEADAMFNSALIYELAVLKKCAEPLLAAVPTDQPEYTEAVRLLDFLSYFESIDEDDIPINSILREFIGKSCFQ